MTSDSKMFNYSSNWLSDKSRSIPNAVRFWVYLIILIPSMICSVFTLSCLLRNRTLRSALHNHAIIIFLLICLISEVTIYPWMLHFLYYESIWKRTPFFCTIWVFFDWALYFTQTILFAWASIERHILIFHDKWVATENKRFLVHYLPLIMIIVYCLTYYISVIFVPPCANTFNDSYMFCVDLCSFKSFALYTYDSIVHQVLPNMIIVMFSMGLLIRIYWQKRRIGRSLRWRKHWKMTVQLLFIAIIYLIFAFPITLMNLLYFYGIVADLNYNFIEYGIFVNYCITLLCPITSTFLLPQLANERNNILRLLVRRTAVAPIR